MSENSTDKAEINIVVAKDGHTAGKTIVALALSGELAPPKLDLDTIDLGAEVRRLRAENEGLCGDLRTALRQRDAVQTLREREIDRIKELIAASPAELERRLITAWRASGMGLGKLLVLATNAYALGAAVSTIGIADEAMVSMAERWVREHPPEGA